MHPLHDLFFIIDQLQRHQEWIDTVKFIVAQGGLKASFSSLPFIFFLLLNRCCLLDHQITQCRGFVTGNQWQTPHPAASILFSSSLRSRQAPKVTHLQPPIALLHPPRPTTHPSLSPPFLLFSLVDPGDALHAITTADHRRRRLPSLPSYVFHRPCCFRFFVNLYEAYDEFVIPPPQQSAVRRRHLEQSRISIFKYYQTN